MFLNINFNTKFNITLAHFLAKYAENITNDFNISQAYVQDR